jgi:hypothetical protein
MLFVVENSENIQSHYRVLSRIDRVGSALDLRYKLVLQLIYKLYNRYTFITDKTGSF